MSKSCRRKPYPPNWVVRVVFKKSNCFKHIISVVEADIG